MKNAKTILSDVLLHTQESIHSLAKTIGLKRSQNLYDIENGKVKKISPELSEKIIIAFPEINRSWLLTGEGTMLINNNQATEYPPQQDSISLVSDYKEKYLTALEEIRDLQKKLLENNAKQDSTTLKKVK